MAENSKIEWCHHTFNPWRGCTKISPGCTHCYAETMSKRNPGTLGVWGDKGTRVIAAPSYWMQPMKWERAARKAKERHRVFCASMADVFEDRPELVTPRGELFQLFLDTPNLDWLLLTKRPENVKRMSLAAWGRFDNDQYTLPENCWLGVSVEDRARKDRIDTLRTIPAAVRFLSVEPLIEDLGSLNLDGIGWVIVGGESGPGARPCRVEWVQSILEQCQSAGVSCFIKQLGAEPRAKNAMSDGFKVFSGWDGESYRVHLKDKKGGDMADWPESLRVRSFPERSPTNG